MRNAGIGAQSQPCCEVFKLPRYWMGASADRKVAQAWVHMRDLRFLKRWLAYCANFQRLSTK